jgi:hypothetical protein
MYVSAKLAELQSILQQNIGIITTMRDGRYSGCMGLIRAVDSAEWVRGASWI